MTGDTVCSKTTLRLSCEESSDKHVVTASLKVPKTNNKSLSFFTVIRTLYEYAIFIILIIFPACRKWSRAIVTERELQTDECNWEVERDDSTSDIRRTNMKVQYRKQIEATSTKMQVLDLQILKVHIRSAQDELADQRNDELMTVNERLHRENQHLQQILQENLNFQEKFDDDLRILREGKDRLQQELVAAKRSEALARIKIPRLYRQNTYEGILKFSVEDVHIIMDRLIEDLKPQVAITLCPGLPAYIIFMCVRYCDYKKNHIKARALMTNFINALKRGIIVEVDDFEYLVLWLNNTFKLKNLMKQYSKEADFRLGNEKCLSYLNLNEYHEMLNNMVLLIFHKTIKQLKKRIQPYVIPALLEREENESVLIRRARSSLNVQEENPSSTSNKEDLQLLLENLNTVHQKLQSHSIDTLLIQQIFNHMFDFISSSVLNNLLRRDALYRWNQGIQLHSNLGRLERWANDEMLNSATNSLQPSIQAAKLMMSNKQDDNVDLVCEMCNKLTAYQIITILRLYKPEADFDKGVPPSFLTKVQAKLQEKGTMSKELLMNLDYVLPVTFPFRPSNVRLKDIEIPDILRLSILKKI